MTARRFCEFFREHSAELLPLILDTLDWFVDEGEDGTWDGISSEVAAGLFANINSTRRGNHNFGTLHYLIESWAANIGMALGAAVLENYPDHDKNMTPAHRPH